MSRHNIAEAALNFALTARYLTGEQNSSKEDLWREMTRQRLEVDPDFACLKPLEEEFAEGLRLELEERASDLVACLDRLIAAITLPAHIKKLGACFWLPGPPAMERFLWDCTLHEDGYNSAAALWGAAMQGDTRAQGWLRELLEENCPRWLPFREALRYVVPNGDSRGDSLYAAVREIEAAVLSARRLIVALAVLLALLLLGSESQQKYSEPDEYGLSPPKPLTLLPQVQPTCAPNA